jgi:hypothetical protein
MRPNCSPSTAMVSGPAAPKIHRHHRNTAYNDQVSAGGDVSDLNLFNCTSTRSENGTGLMPLQPTPTLQGGSTEPPTVRSLTRFQQVRATQSPGYQSVLRCFLVPCCLQEVVQAAWHQSHTTYPSKPMVEARGCQLRTMHCSGPDLGIWDARLGVDSNVKAGNSSQLKRTARKRVWRNTAWQQGDIASSCSTLQRMPQKNKRIPVRCGTRSHNTKAPRCAPGYPQQSTRERTIGRGL